MVMSTLDSPGGGMITTTSSSSSSRRSLIQERLEKLQTTLDKATDDAWKQASLSSPRSISLNDSNKTTTNDENDENASFLLGMDLFGQDPQTLEREIRDKLDDVEYELERVLKESNDNDDDDDNDDTNNSKKEEGMIHDESSPSSSSVMDPERIAAQVAFLKEASLARAALDESSTWASAALTSEPNVRHASEQLVIAKEHCDKAALQMPSTEQATAILQGLQHALRRQKIELIHKASSVLDTSISIGSTDSNNELSVKSSAQLDEAYQVLETLEGGPLALEETMRRWTRRLYDRALVPLLEPFRTQQISSWTPWIVKETEDQPNKRIIGVSASTTKGVVHRIAWHRTMEDDDDHHHHDNKVTTTTSDHTAENKSLEGPVELWKDTLQVLQRILVFVQSKVLLERPRLCQLVGNKLFGKPTAMPSSLHLNTLGLESTMLGDDNGLLMEELLHLLAKTCLPDQLEPEQVTTLLPARSQELLNACTSFCNELIDRQLMIQDTTPKLIAFSDNFGQKYVDHRRCVLLNQARDILKDHDYHNTITVGQDEDDIDDPNMAIFLLHKSSISEIASQLMTLLRQTMKESITMPDQPETLQPTLYKTAREMLSLFRSIIPALYGHEVATVPRTAAVLHNDAMYFAHHCLTLGIEFKEQYKEDDARGKLLRQCCIFVDLVPLFRELADQSLGDMLEVQADQLAEIVGNRIAHFGPSLQSEQSSHEWSEAETALAAGIYHLRHLAKAWRPILSKRIFAQSMGHLADVLLTLFWNQITPQKTTTTTTKTQSSSSSATITTISPTARHFLLGLFRKALQDLKELFVNPKPERCMEDCSNEYGRCQALLQFLDSSNLSQVQADLASGVYKQVAGPELAQWIQAMYYRTDDDDDTPQRQSLLQSLAAV